MTTQDETRTFLIECSKAICKTRCEVVMTAAFGVGGDRTEWHGQCPYGHDLIKITAEPFQTLAAATPYRVRCRQYRFVGGQRQWMGEGWIKGFATAAQAELYWSRATRLVNVVTTGTRPDATAPNGRAWVTLDQLRAIARKERA